MGDDWDPFADPAEADLGSATNAVEKQEIEKPTDIVAALAAPPRQPAPMTSEEFQSLLEEFFTLIGTVDFEIVEDAFRPVAKAIEENVEFRLELWKRGAALIHDCAVESPPSAKLNALGLLVDELYGFNADLDNNWPSGTAFEPPPDRKPCGIVIFLFGFGGARCADLDDVAELYRASFPGAVIMRLESNRFDSWGMRLEVAQAIRASTWAWKEMDQEATPQLLVHAFSNGGFFIWEEMLISWQQLSERETEVPELGMKLPPMSAVLRGIIIDSAPDATPEIVSQIQSLAQSSAGFIRAAVASDHDESEAGRKDAEVRSRRAIIEVIGANSPVKKCLAEKPGAERLILHMCSARTKRVHQLEPPVPMQFIYSTADAIIRYEGIEDYIKEVDQRPNRKGLPPPCRLRFEKTKHCLHKVEKKDEYMSCVRNFVAGVLSSEPRAAT